MAADLEKLVVQLSADVKSYENTLGKAAGITRRQLRLIKEDAGQPTRVLDGVAQASALSETRLVWITRAGRLPGLIDLENIAEYLRIQRALGR